jgi:lipopolysaccharide transport system permease protein
MSFSVGLYGYFKRKPSMLQRPVVVSSLPVTVYTPSSPLKHPAALIVGMLRDIWAGRGLAWRLFRRDTAALYRQSILGYFWTVLPPLATTGAFVFLNSQNILVVGETPVPYAAYVMVGSVLWQTFVDALNSPLRAVAANKSLLVKINFPREALIMAGMMDVGFNFSIRLLLLVLVFWIFHLSVGSSILLFPMGVGAVMLLGLSFGLFLTPIGLLYSDVGRGLTVITTFWLFLTPVVYPPPRSGLAAYLTTSNPVSPVILTTRDWLISQPAAHLTGFVVVTSLALLFLLVGGMIYRIALPHLIERMGA